MKKLIWITSLFFLVVGSFVACHHFEGELPDGRWEWSIGTNERITEVISLEDQIDGEK